MNDAAVVEDIQPDLIEEADAEAAKTEDVVDEEQASEEETEDKTEETEDEPSESSAEKKDDSFQSRIDELTGKYRSEERARIEAEAKYQQTQQRLQALEEAKPIEPDKTLADFEYDEGQYASYLSDVARQTAQQEVKQQLEQERKTTRQLEFKAREDDFGRNVDDYNQVTRNPDLQITETMVEVLQAAEKGPEVLYYLGTNPDVARSLAQMSPLDMAREMGRIEASKLVKPEPKKESKTPPPPPKLKAGNSVTRIAPDSPESDKLSDEEWLKRERKRLAAKDK